MEYLSVVEQREGDVCLFFTNRKMGLLRSCVFKNQT